MKNWIDDEYLRMNNISAAVALVINPPHNNQTAYLQQESKNRAADERRIRKWDVLSEKGIGGGPSNYLSERKSPSFNCCLLCKKSPSTAFGCSSSDKWIWYGRGSLQCCLVPMHLTSALWMLSQGEGTNGSHVDNFPMFSGKFSSYLLRVLASG